MTDMVAWIPMVMAFPIQIQAACLESVSGMPTL